MSELLNKSAFIKASFPKNIKIHLFSSFASFSPIFFRLNEKSDRIK